MEQQIYSRASTVNSKTVTVETVTVSVGAMTVGGSEAVSVAANTVSPVDRWGIRSVPSVCAVGGCQVLSRGDSDDGHEGDDGELEIFRV